MIKKTALTIVLVFIFLFGKAQYNKELIIEPVLKTDSTTIGQKIIYPQFKENEITILKITFLSGVSTGWHKHEFPVFAYVLEGELTIELENNNTMVFCKNSAFPEVMNVYHNGVNKGKENVVLIAFFMGEKGKGLSVHKESGKDK